MSSPVHQLCSPNDAFFQGLVVKQTGSVTKVSCGEFECRGTTSHRSDGKRVTDWEVRLKGIVDKRTDPGDGESQSRSGTSQLGAGSTTESDDAAPHTGENTKETGDSATKQPGDSNAEATTPASGTSESDMSFMCVEGGSARPEGLMTYMAITPTKYPETDSPPQPFEIVMQIFKSASWRPPIYKTTTMDFTWVNYPYVDEQKPKECIITDFYGVVASFEHSENLSGREEVTTRVGFCRELGPNPDQKSIEVICAAATCQEDHRESDTISRFLVTKLKLDALIPHGPTSVEYKGFQRADLVTYRKDAAGVVTLKRKEDLKGENETASTQAVKGREQTASKLALKPKGEISRSGAHYRMILPRAPEADSDLCRWRLWDINYTGFNEADEPNIVGGFDRKIITSMSPQIQQRFRIMRGESRVEKMAAILEKCSVGRPRSYKCILGRDKNPDIYQWFKHRDRWLLIRQREGVIGTTTIGRTAATDRLEQETRNQEVIAEMLYYAQGGEKRIFLGQMSICLWASTFFPQESPDGSEPELNDDI